MDKHADDAELDGPQRAPIVTDAGSCIFTLDQMGTDLHWRSEVAAGPADAIARVTVRISIAARFEHATLAPIAYEFGTPAIVRTLLRELDIHDGLIECTADPVAEVGASTVPDLLSLLEDHERRLPVVVVSRERATGSTLLDTTELTRELAGLAHVRVLSSSHAAWTLTNTAGQEFAVWDGAIRTYFAGFTTDEDPRRHRVTFPDRIDASTVGRLRSWLGTMSTATTPEHPAYGEQRRDRQERIRQAVESADVPELREYIQLLEVDNEAERTTAAEQTRRVAELEDELVGTQSELDQVKRGFAEVTLSLKTVKADDDDVDWEPDTVGKAMDALEELAQTRFYKPRVRLAPSAISSGRKFNSYYSPAEMLRACQAVLEAGALYHDDRLGMTPMEFFNKRGFGYGAQPSPHLKVDDYKSPDQCLRVYWDADPVSRTWTISSIGEHA